MEIMENLILKRVKSRICIFNFRSDPGCPVNNFSRNIFIPRYLGFSCLISMTLTKTLSPCQMLMRRAQQQQHTHHHHRRHHHHHGHDHHHHLYDDLHHRHDNDHQPGWMLMRRAGHLAGQEPGVSLSGGRIVSLDNNVFVCVVYVVIVTVFAILLSFQKQNIVKIGSAAASQTTWCIPSLPLCTSRTHRWTSSEGMSLTIICCQHGQRNR